MDATKSRRSARAAPWLKAVMDKPEVLDATIACGATNGAILRTDRACSPCIGDGLNDQVAVFELLYMLFVVGQANQRSVLQVPQRCWLELLQTFDGPADDPALGPSLAGRSNSTTGTLTLTRCATICAPITPAPSTATFFTTNRFMTFSILAGARSRAPSTPEVLLHPLPHLRAVKRADSRASQLGAALYGFEAGAMNLAIFRVRMSPPSYKAFIVGALLEVAQNRQAQHRFVFALVRRTLSHTESALVSGSKNFSTTPL